MQDIKKIMIKKSPLVSILINNYNKEYFCVKAVKSIINQNYNNIEIIFYDDNSSDFSINRIKEFKKKSKIKKLKIIENKIRENIFSGYLSGRSGKRKSVELLTTNIQKVKS